MSSVDQQGSVQHGFSRSRVTMLGIESMTTSPQPVASRGGLDLKTLLDEYEALKAEDPGVEKEALEAAEEMRQVPLDELDESIPGLRPGQAAGKVGRRAPPNPFRSPVFRRLTRKEIPMESKTTKAADPALVKNPLRGRLIVTISVNAALFMIYLQSLVLNRVETGYFHAARSSNSNLGASGIILYNLGGLNTNALRQGETMRLFWSMWMHSGWIHIGLNIVCQLQYFYMLEPDWGIMRTFLTFWFSGITGNLVSAIMDPCKTTVGSSGGLFGLMGAIIPYCIEFWHTIPRPMWILIFSILTALITLATGLSASTDTWAHAGGFVGGLLFGFGTITTPAAFLPKEKIVKRQVRKNPWMRWLQQTVNPDCKCGVREWSIRIISWALFVGIWLTGFLLIYQKYEYKPPGSLTWKGITKCCCCYNGSGTSRSDWLCDSCDSRPFASNSITWGETCAAKTNDNNPESRNLLEIFGDSAAGVAGPVVFYNATTAATAMDASDSSVA